jgi:hypothetical protein
MIDSIFEDLSLLGLCSAVLSIAAYLPYARDTLNSKTRPKRASWLIWSVLSSIALLSQIAEGASSSLWFMAVQCLGTVMIFILAVSRSDDALFTTENKYILSAAALGLVFWALSDSAVYALAMTIIVSALGSVLTIFKAYKAPETETISTWLLFFVSSGLALAAIGTMDWILLAYPLYLFCLYGLIVAAMLMGRMQNSQETQPLVP